jgi:hypothetical protein
MFLLVGGHRWAAGVDRLALLHESQSLTLPKSSPIIGTPLMRLPALVIVIVVVVVVAAAAIASLFTCLTM